MRKIKWIILIVILMGFCITSCDDSPGGNNQNSDPVINETRAKIILDSITYVLKEINNKLPDAGFSSPCTVYCSGGYAVATGTHTYSSSARDDWTDTSDVSLTFSNYSSSGGDKLTLISGSGTLKSRDTRRPSSTGIGNWTHSLEYTLSSCEFRYEAPGIDVDYQGTVSVTYSSFSEYTYKASITIDGEIYNIVK